MSDEWDEKAREITACPKAPDATSAERMCPFGWNSCRRAAECDLAGDIATALRAADRRGIERAAKWHDANAAACTKFVDEGIEIEANEDGHWFHKTAAEHIRALAQPAATSDSE